MLDKNGAISVNSYRTHTCGQLRIDHTGAAVRLSGWVKARRDHGGLIFLDLGDKWGITQLTANPKKSKEVWKVADTIRNEAVVRVEGTVVKRPSDMINVTIATGEVEVEVTEIEILSVSKALPFDIDKSEGVNEELRLAYRFLDLRSERLQRILKLRDEVIAHVRSYMRGHGFTEVQTPILANSSPEGARDFLVPSRLHPGTFYALPQAPQQFKQLLMVGGLDRYFQIAPCFRDEDPRADRHSGDFYQIDLEMSFIEQEDVFDVVEPLMVELTETFTDKKIAEKPFPRVSWRDAMTQYGTDKPDIRFNLPINAVTNIVTSCAFKVFNSAIDAGGVVHALRVEGGATFSRSDIDELENLTKRMGGKGLAYIVVKDTLVSPIIKHLGMRISKAVVQAVGAKPGDIVFFAADSWKKVCSVLGAVRIACAEKLSLCDDRKAAWVWVIDFPMYERNEETGAIEFSHNPFSMPQGGLQALNTSEPTSILGYQYDLALNGYEISSGAIRNHRPDIMYRAFELAGYSKEDVDKKFGGMIKAFEYGAPPHGGFAPGIDRLLMVLFDLKNIRDVYAFPKNGKGQDVMMGSPSPVDQKQLKELSIKLDLS